MYEEHRRAAGSDASERLSSPPKAGFTLQEVARHTTENDCWLVIKGKVYDVSGWAEAHPGGRAVYAFAGRDATDVFNAFHPPAAFKMLANHCIGELVDSPPPAALLADFRALRLTLQRQGLFKSSKRYYAGKVLGNVVLLAAAIALLVGGKASVLSVVGSALLLGLFWQQSGWLAHDFAHHQVFTDRRFNNLGTYVLGNIWQGFSLDWWKSKHNLHHAACNALTATHDAVDPDIDTLPLLAWSAQMLPADPSTATKTQRILVRWQHVLFFPILLFARFNWAIGSIVHAWRLARRTRRGKTELCLLAVHYTWYLGLAALLPWPSAILWATLAQIFSGAFLAIVFVQSHSGMEVYSAPKDFVTAQVISSRDISPTAWNAWFTGGLNFQIEHHLFPTLPRHNLAAVCAPVRALCAKHGLAYETCGMTESTQRVITCLKDIAAQA